MKLTRLFTLICILLAIGVTTPVIAQVKGGRKKEHRNQRGGGGKLFGKKPLVEMQVLLLKVGAKEVF